MFLCLHLSFLSQLSPTLLQQSKFYLYGPQKVLLFRNSNPPSTVSLPSSSSSDALPLSAATSQSRGRQADASSTDCDTDCDVQDQVHRPAKHITSLHVNTKIFNQWNMTNCPVSRYFTASLVSIISYKGTGICICKFIVMLLVKTMSFGANYSKNEQ